MLLILPLFGAFTFLKIGLLPFLNIMLALLAVTRIMSSLDIVVLVLAGVVLVAAITLLLGHVKPPVGISSLNSPSDLCNTLSPEVFFLHLFHSDKKGKSV